MSAPADFVAKLTALRFMPAGELERLCLQRRDDFVALLDELQLRFPEHRIMIGRLWADAFNLAFVDLETTRIDPHVCIKLDHDLAMREEVVALYEFEGVLTLATAHPENQGQVERLRTRLGTEVSFVFAFPSQIVDVIEVAYQSRDSLAALIEQSDIRALTGAGGKLTPAQMRDLAGNEYVIKFVRGLLLLALSEQASDIHIEPCEKGVRIRFRIDGVLQERFLLDAAVSDPVLSRLKIMAEQDITERRLPQDGRITVVLRDSSLDVRFSSVPALYGEKVVLRLLGRNKRRSIPDLEDLHVAASVYRDLRRVCDMPSGLFLVTGPTGSGKTTTLFALLKQVSTPDVNILTVEDPVEYRLEGATQVQVNGAVGLDFATALRAFLRQDPDVILVGEIRDPESGRIAAQAALTGHLVLSTLHTNSALQSVTRLADMGVEPYLVAPALAGVMAQRLVRRICPACRAPCDAPREAVARHFHNADGAAVRFWRGEGCERCGQQGFSGRVALHEVFLLNPEVRDLITRRGTAGEVAAAARRAGFRTMRYDGLKKVLRGLTTLEQVESAVCGIEDE